MKIEKAQNTDSKNLTELTIRSKSHWGYSSEQINKWKDDLTIPTEYIDQYEVYKLMQGQKVIGYYSYKEVEDKIIKLDNIFLEPSFIGKGLGKIMMNHFFKIIEVSKYETIRLDSDPNAEKFYQNLGFKVIGRLESSIPNRFLPIMELKINTTRNTNVKKQ
ncbi:MAG: GNAT family N-acetyltransferase [Crocinitomicaceae bacterium]